MSAIQDLQAQIDVKQTYLDKLQTEINHFDASEHLSEDEYQEMLDEDTVRIGMLTYPMGECLKQVDYTAFREGYNDWVDGYDLTDIQACRELTEEAEQLQEEIDELMSEISDIESNE
jgi:hypothetical protein